MNNNFVFILIMSTITINCKPLKQTLFKKGSVKLRVIIIYVICSTFIPHEIYVGSRKLIENSQL